MNNNLLESVRRLFKNKNTVTILGVIGILVLLYIGYSVQINNAVKPISVPVATETIQPRTQITESMFTMVSMPSISIDSDQVITSSAGLIGNYSNVNSLIPKGSMFFRSAVVKEEDLPDAVFAKVKKGQVVYNFAVNLESTYGNSIFPGNKIDIYMKVGNGVDEKVMIGKLLENIEVLAVKDSSGRSVFENTNEFRTPSMLIFGLSPEHNLLLRKASYLNSLGVVLYPVPQSTSDTSSNDATQVSTQELRDYIEAHSVNIQVTEEEEDDKLIPTITETGGANNTVTISYPDGCGSNYVCTYSKDGGKEVTAKSSKENVIFTAKGKLTATVTEKDGTPHTITVDIPLANSTTGNN